ncbi:MAG: HAMP domain-containing sensor histidine kinase, partial [Ferruginibacter sp.]
VAGSLTILWTTFSIGSIISSLVTDSQISFDVVNFFSLNIYSIIGFVVLCCLAIAYYFLCQVILYLLKPFFGKSFWELFLAITIFSLIFLSFKIGDMQGGFAISLLAWLLLFLFLLNNNYFNLIASRVIASQMVFWLFFFSISITAVIILENNKNEMRNREHYAEILATKSDPASEILLNTMLTDFRVDFLADNLNRFKNERQNKALKDSLINNNFSGYTNRFDTHVFTFDQNEQPLFNEINTDYNSLNTILNSQARPTGIEGLYYYDESYERFSFISKKNITDTSGTTLGTVFIVVSPRNVKNEALYPELFSKGNNSAIEQSSVYAFAIYNQQRLVSSHNDYPFATTLPSGFTGGEQFKRINKDGYDELWYNAGADKYVVIVKENNTSIETITLFSYLFCGFLILTSLLWLLSTVIRSRLNRSKFEGYWQLTIRNQVHGIIIFISTISFIVIGIATILFFISRYENNNREKLSSTIKIMENQLNKQIADSVMTTDSSGVQRFRRLQALVNTISEIHGVDVNLYDLQGDLIISSLPLPYDKGIVSPKINPVAYFHLHHLNEVQFFQKESIGRLNFVSSYVPVVNNSGNVYAYLNIPYFTSQSKLKQEISNFLVTIINLNAFIFLIAGIVALFITNRITNSFSVISDKMKEINLGTHNEAIEWSRKDEIGDLVKEYNKMLGKLEQSAEALAKNEREGAWREMARQVAHEIKNPLTPMKLSMQFLQKSIENDSPNVKQLAQSVSSTLIEQIDHLSNIAGEFSQFANISQAHNEYFDLNESLRSIKLLYSSGELDVDWYLLNQPLRIFGDKTHVNRLFTNLIQNAIQAMPEGRRPHIEVFQKINKGRVEVQLKDNGEGIDEKIREKIFTPNFTTKTSGTGLGLAMCKRIVEQMNGDIWFETSAGKGTSFFLNFPLA